LTIIGPTPASPKNILFQSEAYRDLPLTFYSYDTETETFSIKEQIDTAEFARSNELIFHPLRPEFYLGSRNYYTVTREGLTYTEVNGRGPTLSAFSPDGNWVSYEDGEVGSVIAASEYPGGKSIDYQTSLPPQSYYPVYINGYHFSDSGYWLVANDTYGSHLHRRDAREIVAKLGFDDDGKIEVAFNSDESRLAVVSVGYRWNETTQKKDKLPRFDMRPLSKADGSADPLMSTFLPHHDHYLVEFSADQQSVHILDFRSGQLLAFDATDLSQPPVEVNRLPLPGLTSHCKQADVDGWNAFAVGQTIMLLSRKDPTQPIRSFEASDSVSKIDFLGGTDLLFAQLKNERIEIFDPAKGDSSGPVAQLDFFNRGDDYLLLGRNGAIDASEGIRENGIVQQGTRFSPLSEVFEQNYQPTLTAQLAGNFTLPAPIAKRVTEQRPPTAQIRSHQVKPMTYRFDLSGASSRSGVTEMLFSQNGKVIRSQRANSLDSMSIRRLEVDLLPEKNIFTLVVIDEDGVLSEEAVFEVMPPQAVIDQYLSTAEQSRLHILAVGIDTYHNPEYRLNYAVADADAISKKLQALNRDLFASVETTSL
jgi:hypothetical protein